MIAPTSGYISEGLRMLCFMLFIAIVLKKLFHCASRRLGVLQQDGAGFGE